MTIKQRYNYCLRKWEEALPNPEGELHYNDPFELLVAVMLSAQCTDKRVNMVTPSLFAEYPTVQDMANASVQDILTFIHSVSYPNSKAAYLSAASKMIVEDFGGEVPDTVEELTRLPGVGRKTANVVCAVMWQQPTMAVDTHIFRVAERIGLTTGSKSPLHTEQVLVRYIPQDLIPKAHHWILLHGRYICVARKPHCEKCALTEVCRYFKMH